MIQCTKDIKRSGLKDVKNKWCASAAIVLFSADGVLIRPKWYFIKKVVLFYTIIELFAYFLTLEN